MNARKPVSFREFRQLVRRYRPDELLPLVAARAASIVGPPYDLNDIRKQSPWGLALIARESVLWGNNYRRSGFTEMDLNRLINVGNNLALPSDASIDTGIHSLLTRVAYEQFPYQESQFEELARTHALLIEGSRHLQLEVLSEEAWVELLGAPLPDVVGATFVLSILATARRGWFDLAELGHPEFAELLNVYPEENLRRRLNQLSGSKADLRARFAAVPQPGSGLEQYGFNPLTVLPFLNWRGSGRYLAPQPRLILRTVTPGNLYYEGIHTWGESFTRDLGRLTEWYVGEQLRSIPGAEVVSEITYSRSKDKSVDWFLVGQRSLVLFEVKSARFGLLDRAASVGFEDRISAVLGKAIGQLHATHEALESGHPDMEALPRDRAVIGVVVTAEPYYLANTDFVRDLLPMAPFPTLMLSLRDLEALVRRDLTTIEDVLLEASQQVGREGGRITSILEGRKSVRPNRLLERAWDAYPWPELDD